MTYKIRVREFLKTDRVDTGIESEMDLSPTEPVLFTQEAFTSNRSGAPSGAVELLAVAMSLTLAAFEQQNTVHNFEMRCMHSAVRGLLDVRDFMGLQLDHAWGNVDDDSFGTRADQFLASKEGRLTTELARTVSFLASQTTLDTETISEVLNVKLDEVRHVLTGTSLEVADT